MPFVRGRIVPEIESAGRAKNCLDVLLWLPRPSRDELAFLDLVDVLRTYLLSIRPSPCLINFWLPSAFAEAGRALNAFGIAFRTVLTMKQSNE